MVAIESVTEARPIDFVQLAYWALFDDLLAHSMRVLDKHKKAASFWFLYKSDKSQIDHIAKEQKIDLERLTPMSEALKLVRDKTHFHIDRDAVIDPKSVWQKAEIKAPELKSVLDELYVILNAVHEKTFGRDFWLPEYDGSDVKEMIKISQAADIIF